MGVFVFVVFGLLLYFIPTLVAANRKHRNSTAIFVLNFFLGWSLIGWVIALIWSVANSSEVALADNPKPRRTLKEQIDDDLLS